eukprot:1678023-Amphidinium_carterae.1
MMCMPSVGNPATPDLSHTNRPTIRVSERSSLLFPNHVQGNSVFVLLANMSQAKARDEEISRNRSKPLRQQQKWRELD